MIVMKFGGSSVQDSTAIRRVASIVASRLAEQPLVVVSAMGGVTDKLVQVADLASRGELAPALEILEAIRGRHILASSEMLVEPALSAFAAELDTRLAEATALGSTDRLPGLDHSRAALLHADLRRAALQRNGGGGLQRPRGFPRPTPTPAS